VYKIFTPTRNAVDFRIHSSSKEHRFMKGHEDRYVAVIEKHTLDGAHTITVMKHNHRYVTLVKSTHSGLAPTGLP